MAPRRSNPTRITAACATLILLAAVPLSACGSGTGSRTVGTETTTLPIAGATALRVADRSGAITITGGDGDTVEAVVRITSNKGTANDAQAREAAKAVAATDGDTAIVETIKELPDGYGADLTITAPKGMALSVTDTSGDLTINGWDGAITVDDSSGDISISNTAAPKGKAIVVNDTSGHLTITGWDGEVTIDDTSGDIVLSNVTKYTIASDTSGDVIVDGKKAK